MRGLLYSMRHLGCLLAYAHNNRAIHTITMLFIQQPRCFEAAGHEVRASTCVKLWPARPSPCATVCGPAAEGRCGRGGRALGCVHYGSGGASDGPPRSALPQPTCAWPGAAGKARCRCKPGRAAADFTGRHTLPQGQGMPACARHTYVGFSCLVGAVVSQQWLGHAN
jgi:hypothetical protein